MSTKLCYYALINFFKVDCDSASVAVKALAEKNRLKIFISNSETFLHRREWSQWNATSQSNKAHFCCFAS